MIEKLHAFYDANQIMITKKTKKSERELDLKPLIFDFKVVDLPEELIEESVYSYGLQMMVSPICMKDGEKTAYVTFSDGSRHAEGEIPKCVVIKSEGFDNDEIYQLENYMEENLDMLKSMAASVNPIKAMMKDK